MKLLILTLAAVGLFADGIQPPAGQQEILRAHGVGDQIYTCKAAGEKFAWVLKAPDAQLLSADQKVVGRHFAGPTWEWSDQSTVVGKVAASQPSTDPDSVPWLLINVVEHKGDGMLSPVVTIQRVNTHGGKASAGGCDASHADALQRVHYEADYVFWK